MSIQINGPRLKAEIARRGLTQAEFAARAGIVPNTITNVMNGKPVQQFILQRIAVALQNTPVLEQLDALIASPVPV
jgi:transcriptional regulator with XRE-family HTH domain